jgi:biofilm PGA synthesis N-glycosyltransferase PgaC
LIAFLFLILSGLYFIILIAVYLGLARLKKPDENRFYSISIIVAARNEEKRIFGCLESLEKLDYPQEKFEIIFVDDNSEDKTAEIIKAYCQKNSNWKLIQLEEKSEWLKGKKNALLNGIAQASGELIFTTDADCNVPSSWLKKMVNYFHPKVSMVLGYSPLIRYSKFYFKLLQFDNLFSSIASAAPTKLGYPFTSVGRNLAYRKDSYEEMGGFQVLQKFRSGDDVHLTGHFRYKKNGIIDFCADPDTFVQTQIPSSFKEVIQQQIRKNSKTFQLSWSSIIFMLNIFIYYLLLILIPVLLPAQLYLWGTLLFIKFALEYVTLLKAANIFKQRDLILYIPLMQVIYPPYIIFFSIIGTFQFYQWKK